METKTFKFGYTVVHIMSDGTVKLTAGPHSVLLHKSIILAIAKELQ